MRRVGRKLTRIAFRRTVELALGVAAMLCVVSLVASSAGAAGGGPSETVGLKVLPPMVHGNLALYPVVAAGKNDTSMLMSLDEGIGSGQVTVTEAGDERGLVRRGEQVLPRRGGPEVNRLVLTNNGDKPLLLLAGEIVTGGKQDRVIGADRIVPSKSGPIDLGVFCVEPGRWVASSSAFGSMGIQMAQPSVRIPAMAEKSQARVWENVRTSNAQIMAAAPAPARQSLQGTTSYAKVFSNSAVASSVLSEYGGVDAEHTMLRELKQKGAVGVVVGINGELTWADVFASNDLLSRYWPKLLRSYVAEAMTRRASDSKADVQDAQKFLENRGGTREVVETEPGVFRRSDLSGEGYRIFELTALVPKTGYVVHMTKMRQ